MDAPSRPWHDGLESPSKAAHGSSVCTVRATLTELDDSGMQGSQALHEVDMCIRGAASDRGSGVP